MEPDKDRIAEIVRTMDATEDEARILYHLEAADRAMGELIWDPGKPTPLTPWHIHIDAVKNSVLARILKRKAGSITWP